MICPVHDVVWAIADHAPPARILDWPNDEGVQRRDEPPKKTAVASKDDLLDEFLVLRVRKQFYAYARFTQET